MGTGAHLPLTGLETRVLSLKQLTWHPKLLIPVFNKYHSWGEIKYIYGLQVVDMMQCSYTVQWHKTWKLQYRISFIGHINIHITCRTTNMPKHVSVASRTTEIWPFEFHEIIGEVWTLVIAFLGGNSKIGLRQAVDQVLYYDYQSPVLSSARKWRRR